jgi:NAD/NADP transhydrogenase alpha subunit
MRKDLLDIAGVAVLCVPVSAILQGIIFLIMTTAGITHAQASMALLVVVGSVLIILLTLAFVRGAWTAGTMVKILAQHPEARMRLKADLEHLWENRWEIYAEAREDYKREQAEKEFHSR